jgi:hypothetical protein
LNAHDRKNRHQEKNSQLRHTKGKISIRHIKKGRTSFDTSRRKESSYYHPKGVKASLDCVPKRSKIVRNSSEGSNVVLTPNITMTPKRTEGCTCLGPAVTTSRFRLDRRCDIASICPGSTPRNAPAHSRSNYQPVHTKQV